MTAEYLQGAETGLVRQLPGFDSRIHSAPRHLSSSAESWIARLLDSKIREEVDDLYQKTRSLMKVSRQDVLVEIDTGEGQLDCPSFRYSVVATQNPDDAREYLIDRRLELRSEWITHENEILKMFGNLVTDLVLEFAGTDPDFATLVDTLDRIAQRDGGKVTDHAAKQRVLYQTPHGPTVSFDWDRRHIEVSEGRRGLSDLLQTVRQLRTRGADGVSLMLSDRGSPVRE